MKTTASTGESRLKANVTNILGKDKWILTAGIQGSMVVAMFMKLIEIICARTYVRTRCR